MLNQYLGGALTIGFFAAGLFFLRYWKRTSDRLFAMFAVAFWVFAIERIILVLTDPAAEFRPYIYLVRLFAFILIIIAIIDKNRSKN